jgi:hypothetical protein
MEPFEAAPTVFTVTCSVLCLLSFKQVCKMSASFSTLAVRKLYSAAVCFVTLHVLNSARPLILSNVTTLLLLDFVSLAADQPSDLGSTAFVTARVAFPSITVANSR